MGVLLDIISFLGPISQIIAVIMVLIATGIFFGWRFFQSYPYRTIIEHKRAGKDPILGYDRMGRFKTKSGAEVFRLWRAKHAGKRVEIMPVDSKFIITGRGFFNKMTIPLFEDSGRYMPIQMDFGDDYMKMKPIPHRVELDRISLHHQNEVWHNTQTGWDKAKPFVIGGSILVFVIFGVILLTKRDQIFGDIGGMFGGIVPLISIAFKKISKKEN